MRAYYFLSLRAPKETGMLASPWIALNNQITLHKGDGSLDVEKDKDAVRSYFVSHVNPNMMVFPTLAEKIHYFVDEDYYIDFFKMYSEDDLIGVFEAAYRRNFRFGSYMSAYKFYNDYALKTDDGSQYLERYEDRIASCALYLAQGSVDSAHLFVSVMISQEYQPATPTFLNAGRKRSGELVSCFMDEVDDSLQAISRAQEYAAYLSSIGGGVAFNLSKLRARGEPIKGIEDRSSGVLPVMKMFENVFSYANQLGQRPGAGAVYLNIFHWDIEEFLDSKKVNADEAIRIKTLSLGVVVPSKFMDLCASGGDVLIFSPYTVFKEYGIYLDEMNMDEMYDTLANNPKVKKRTIQGRQLLVKIAQTQKESGYPYMIFIDNANNQHPLAGIGKIKFSNLCTEIMQLSEVSHIQYGDPIKIKRGISCNLGSLNIATVMDNKSLENAVYVATVMLTAVTNMTNIEHAPSIQKANDELHSIGLGAMNLHGYLAKNHIMYESNQARDFANVFFMMMNYYSIKASMAVAKSFGKAFKDFHKSDYASGEYFRKYTQHNIQPEYDNVAKLFQGMNIPTRNDWETLAQQVQQHGLYHAYRLTIAPNQSTSYVMNATASVMPITSVIETREYGNSQTFYPMPYLNDSTFFYYKSAYDMDQNKVMKLMSIIQQHVDQGISTILHIRGETDTRSIAKHFIVAHKLGLKSLYYTRTKKSQIDDCIGCEA